MLVELYVSAFSGGNVAELRIKKKDTSKIYVRAFKLFSLLDSDILLVQEATVIYRKANIERPIIRI